MAPSPARCSFWIPTSGGGGRCDIEVAGLRVLPPCHPFALLPATGEIRSSENSYFCQAARQLACVPSSQLCVKLASGGDPTYAFNIRFTGEEVHGTSKTRGLPALPPWLPLLRGHLNGEAGLCSFRSEASPRPAHQHGPFVLFCWSLPSFLGGGGGASAAATGVPGVGLPPSLLRETPRGGEAAPPAGRVALDACPVPSSRWFLPPLPLAGVQGAAELPALPPLALPQLVCQQEQGGPSQDLGWAGQGGAQAGLPLWPAAGARLTLLPPQGKYILTPSPISYSEEQLLHFFGQLLGIAIRADVPLPLDLLPSFWKTLVGEPLDPDVDLQEADILTYNYVKKFENVQLALPSPLSVQWPGQGAPKAPGGSRPGFSWVNCMCPPSPPPSAWVGPWGTPVGASIGRGESGELLHPGDMALHHVELPVSTRYLLQSSHRLARLKQRLAAELVPCLCRRALHSAFRRAPSAPALHTQPAALLSPVTQLNDETELEALCAEIASQHLAMESPDCPNKPSCKFTYLTVTGEEVELCARGRHIPVV